VPIDQLIFLALIQGLTEFLPVSSSAHLILLPLLTAYEDQGVAIDVAVHVGSLGAVTAYFHKEILRLVAAVPDFICFKWTPDARLLGFLALGTIPAVLFGVLLATMDLTDALRSKNIIAWASILFGVLLYLCDRYGAKERSADQLTLKDIVVIGMAQALALIPGTSRSGITMTAGRALGLKRVEAARFSMLLSIPIILASGLFAALALTDSNTPAAWGQAGIAAALSFVAALGTIWIFLKVLDKIGFTPFVLYRIGLGVALLTLF
jgi:undecaprenyl-diphosphatase